MRTYVEVLGVGQRKCGVAKRSGNKYDFTEVSVAYDAPGFQGRKCETIVFDAAVVGDRHIAPGEVLDVVMHQSNFKTYVDAVL